MKIRRKIVAGVLALLVVSAALVVPITSPSEARGADDLEARIKRVENGLMLPVAVKGEAAGRPIAERMAHYRVPGVSIAVINNGKIEWARGYGVTEAGGTTAVTPDTLFQAASISKPVAAMGVLALVERGKLRLDEDVNVKLASWKVPENEFTKEKKVTLRGLLSHSAGMTVHGFRGYAEGEQVPTLVDVLEGRKPANSAPVRVDILPGSRWRYSGGGISVAQQLVMDVTGKPFPEFMRQTVLDPIGMKSSTYEQPLPNRLWPRAAVGHRTMGQQVKGRWHTYPEMAAAGLWTTPSDLARFAIEIQKSRAGKSNKVLSAAMVNRMLTIQSGDYGLGIGVHGSGKALNFGHGGSNEGFRCQMFAYADTGQGAVVMTNGDNGSPLIDEILRSIAREYGWPDYQVKQRAAIKVDPAVFRSFAGEYQIPGRPWAFSVTAEGGRLYLTGAPYGPEKLEMRAETETTYFISFDDALFTFVKDDAGKVVAMRIQLPQGPPIEAKKKE